MIWVFFNFINIFLFSVYTPSTSLVNFTPKYLILFDAIVDGIFFFLIYFLDSSLLVHRNAANFCMLVLYPAILLISFINFYSFLVKSLVFSIYNIMPSANIGNFTFFFFLICILFISFSCLGTPVRTSRTMFNRCSKSGHSCLVPDLKRKASSLSTMWC